MDSPIESPTETPVPKGKKSSRTKELPGPIASLGPEQLKLFQFTDPEEDEDERVFAKSITIPGTGGEDDEVFLLKDLKLDQLRQLCKNLRIKKQTNFKKVWVQSV